MIDIIRHWIPDLKQTKNKNAYTAKQCPFCPTIPNGSKSFRLNVKLKVFKCYQCGRSGKGINKFIHYLKGRDLKKQIIYNKRRYFKKFGCRPMCITNDVHYGCQTYEETLLPF